MANFNINANERWKFGPQPALGDAEFADTVEPAMLIFRDITFAGTVVSSGRVLNPDDNLLYTGITPITNKYNNVQRMINGGVLTCIIQLDDLRTQSIDSSGAEGFLDPAALTEDSVWWAEVQEIQKEARDLDVAHVSFQDQFIDLDADDYNGDFGSGNPSTLATTFQTALDSGGFYATCFGGGGRLEVLDARLGSATTNGYIRELFTSTNNLASKNNGYVVSVYDELFSLSSLYDRIEDLREQYRALEKAEPN